MPTAARERIKGSADTKGALARNPHPASTSRIIYANDVTFYDQYLVRIYIKVYSSY